MQTVAVQDDGDASCIKLHLQEQRSRLIKVMNALKKLR